MIKPIFWYKNFEFDVWVIFRATHFDYMSKNVKWMNDKTLDELALEPDLDLVDIREVVHSEEECLRRVAELYAEQLDS